MGNDLKAYLEEYQDQDQVLFQAIIRLRRGDKRAFEQVYNLSERYIYAIIYRIVRDNDKAVDLMQETYIQIYRKIHTLKNVEAFFVWAGRIATNNTLRFIQRDSREVLASEDDNNFMFENASDDNEAFLPEDILVNKEKRQKIREIINNLSPEQRITVLNYYYGEMSVSEIAQAMQCSPGTVKSRLNYARKQIKQAVLATEKREGVKLYSLSTLPLFTILLREEVATITVPEIVSSSVVKGIAEILGINMGGTVGLEILEVGKKGIKGIKEKILKLFKTTSGKVASGITAAAVAGTVAITQIPSTQAIPGNVVEYTDGIYSEYDSLFLHDIYLEDYGYGGLYWQRYGDDSESKYLIDDEYFICQNDSGYKGVYTIDGEEIIPVEFDQVFHNEFTGGLFWVRKGDKVAYYDKSGKMVCDRMYDDIGHVRDSMFWCYDGDSNEYKIYSLDGQQVSNYTFDYIAEMINGLAVVKKDGKWAVLKEDGSFIVDFIDGDIYLGDGEYITINEPDYQTGEVNIRVLYRNGEVVYNKYSSEEEGFYGGFYNGVTNLSGYIDPMTPLHVPVKVDGTILFNPGGTDYSGYSLHIYPNGSFLYYNPIEEKAALFNSNGQQIVDKDSYYIDYFDDRYLINSSDKKKSLMDDQGNILIEKYDTIEPRYIGKYYICIDENGYDLYNAEGTLLFNDGEGIRSIGCEMFECSLDNETVIVNGQDGTSFSLSQDESIDSNYSYGYAIKVTRLWEEEADYKIEVIDKKGQVQHEIEMPGDDYPDNVIVLKKGVYSYKYKDKCYIKAGKW